MAEFAFPMSAAKKAPKRSGILAGGNWIIDQVKMIDVYPQREQLANITGATVTGTGGSPYNLLINLAKLGADTPLAAAAMHFPLAHPSVAAIIPGALKPEQVSANVETYRRTIPADLWAELKQEGLIREDAPTP